MRQDYCALKSQQVIMKSVSSWSISCFPSVVPGCRMAEQCLLHFILLCRVTHSFVIKPSEAFALLLPFNVNELCHRQVKIRSKSLSPQCKYMFILEGYAFVPCLDNLFSMALNAPNRPDSRTWKEVVLDQFLFTKHIPIPSFLWLSY